MDLNDPSLMKQGTICFRLTNEKRQMIVEALLAEVNSSGKPRRGLMSEIAQKFNVSTRTVSSLWKIASEQTKNGDAINVKARMPSIVGRKRKEVDLSQLHTIPLGRRTNIRSLAASLGIPKSTTHNLVKSGYIRPHSNAIKPSLTENNKIKRVEFCLSNLSPNNTTDNPKFQLMNNVVHIDEKWFYMTQAKQHYYLHENEPEPYRSCQSKGFIGKVMFFCGVALPDIGPDGEVLFDGKIGIFPFITMQPALRKSKNRVAGTMEVKPIPSITKEVIRDFMINKILPAIKEKWPQHRGKAVVIQQDNARPHLSPEDELFRQEATKDGWEITLKCQPPNSPDLNVLDLGWFRAIQTIQNELSPRNVQELIDVVLLAYEKLQVKSLIYIWLTVQTCMLAILKANGGNNYKIPHIGKERLSLLGILPKVIEVPSEIVFAAIQFLNEVQRPIGEREEIEDQIV